MFDAIVCMLQNRFPKDFQESIHTIYHKDYGNNREHQILAYCDVFRVDLLTFPQ